MGHSSGTGAVMIRLSPNFTNNGGNKCVVRVNCPMIGRAVCFIRSPERAAGVVPNPRPCQIYLNCRNARPMSSLKVVAPSRHTGRMQSGTTAAIS